MDFMNEKQYIELAEKILSKVKEKIIEELTENWYMEMETWLYEQYQNVEDKIESKTIEKISDRFIREPNLYKFEGLRERLFEENKEKLIPILTDDFIEANLEEQFLERTNDGYHFSWEWKDAIVKLIIKNWDKFEKDKRINKQIVREIKNRDEYINNLEYKINRLREELNESNDN